MPHVPACPRSPPPGARRKTLAVIVFGADAAFWTSAHIYSMRPGAAPAKSVLDRPNAQVWGQRQNQGVAWVRKKTKTLCGLRPKRGAA